MKKPTLPPVNYDLAAEWVKQEAKALVDWMATKPFSDALVFEVAKQAQLRLIRTLQLQGLLGEYKYS